MRATWRSPSRLSLESVAVMASGAATVAILAGGGKGVQGWLRLGACMGAGTA
jgi:hypothetical protein